MNTKESARTRSEVTKFFVLFLTFSLLLILPGLNGFSEEPVNFPDENLEQAIRDAIDKPSGEIYPSDLEGLTELNAENNGIENLSGIEYCKDLTHLDLGEYESSNKIKDISPLANLTRLIRLDLKYQNVSNLGPISNLTKLERLYLRGNDITNIDQLSELINLTHLNLAENQITNISSLSNLTNLRDLVLTHNNVSEIQPLSNLTNLEDLILYNNKISSIDALSDLTNLKQLNVGNNNLKDFSSIANFTKLEILGLEYMFLAK